MAMWWRVSLVVAVAGVVGLVAALVDGKPVSVAVWAAVAAVVGGFAPSVVELVATRRKGRELARSVPELRPGTWGPASVLTAERAVVDFVGRTKELDGLLDWCSDAGACPLRVITGGGGVGKTRLLVELERRLYERRWGVLWVREGQEATAVENYRQEPRGKGWVLLVVDYAETRTGLRELVRATVADEQVRVVLAGRSAGEWWRRLEGDERVVRELFIQADAERMELTARVSERASNAQVVAEAAKAFAYLFKLDQTPKVEVAGMTEDEPVPILDLHAAALVGVLRSAEQSSATVRVELTDVLVDLLSHEVRYWQGSADAAGLREGPAGLPLEVLRQIVAAGALLGSASQEQAVALAERVPGVVGSRKLAEWLRGLYPPDAGGSAWLGSLRPDRLAELHVTRELAASPELAQRCLSDLDLAQSHQALIVLGRASVDYEPAQELLQQILPLVAQVAADLEAPRETLAAISGAIPYPSLSLAEADAILARKVLDSFPARERSNERAYWLSKVGRSTAQLGRPADALAAAEEAVTIYRELAEHHPDRYRSDLADSLTALGIWLSELGRSREALSPAEEAVTIRRALAEHHPDRYLPDLAASLINLGIWLSELGRQAEALPLAEEAVTIYRGLAEHHPDRYRPNLAASLTNLNVIHSALNRPAEAFHFAEEAVTIYRELAEHHPDRYLPGLAASLANLSDRYPKLGRLAEALPLAEEAVTIYRELTEHHPDRYRPGLAASLAKLSTRYSELDRLAETLSPAEEAVTIRRELAEHHPDRYLPDLAASLTNLGTRYSELDHLAEALPPAEEAVTIYRELAEHHPDRYLPDLAASLTNLGAHYLQLDRPAEAFHFAEEAVTIYRELTEHHPDRYLSGLPSVLTNLSAIYSVLDRLAEALPLAEEAVTIRRELAEHHPDRYLPDLAASLTNLGTRYSELDHLAEALPPAEEAVTIYRELTEHHPDRYRPDLASSLTNLGTYYLQLDRPAEAFHFAEEAVTIYRELTEHHPDRYLPGLASVLTKLSAIYSVLDRLAEALPLAEEAVTIRRELAEHHPHRYLPDLAASLTVLGVTVALLERSDEGLSLVRESVDLWRSLADLDAQRFGPEHEESIDLLRMLTEEKAGGS
ncbi:tetratricopeptide repeat protein [Sphaerisporangium dianthi]|uniref:Tetratricopeptide repeat protein n=1 Tax=Sphaerisporangium dianthi TaxID=1436120 RepID=A0ABV9CAY6_9ACTN